MSMGSSLQAEEDNKIIKQIATNLRKAILDDNKDQIESILKHMENNPFSE